MMNLGENVKVTVLAGPQAAAQSEVDSSALDLSGYEGVLLLTQFGTITSGSDVDIAIQVGATNSPTTVLSTGAVAVADTRSNDVVVHDIKSDAPDVLRYLRVVVTRTTQNAELGGIIAIQYGPRDAATTNDSTTVVSLTTVAV